MQLTQKQIIILAAGGGLALLVFFLILTNLRSTSQGVPVTLTIWGTEPKAAVESITSLYAQYRPNVTIKYEEISPLKYEATLTEALAAGQGPDVFMLDNTAIPRNARRLASVSAEQLPQTALAEQFPTVINQEMSVGGNIYALPLYLDTLALFYSKNALDQAGITEPPRTWADFQTYIPHLRRTGEGSELLVAAGAVGGSERNVKYAPEILSLVMFQNGAAMANSDGSVNFTAKEGVEAFNFYLQFANPGSPSYTWNDAQHLSLDALAEGKASMAFGYRSDLDSLKEKSPYLDVAVAPMLQVKSDNAKNSARYQALAVSKQSKVAAWGWDFVIFAATNRMAVQAFTNVTNHPPALKSAIAELVSSPDMGVFARQALTARAWYRADDRQIRTVLDTAIRKVLDGALDSGRALRQAEDQVAQLMREIVQ